MTRHIGKRRKHKTSEKHVLKYWNLKYNCQQIRYCWRQIYLSNSQIWKDYWDCHIERKWDAKYKDGLRDMKYIVMIQHTFFSESRHREWGNILSGNGWEYSRTDYKTSLFRFRCPRESQTK